MPPVGMGETPPRTKLVAPAPENAPATHLPRILYNEQTEFHAAANTLKLGKTPALPRAARPHAYYPS